MNYQWVDNSGVLQWLVQVLHDAELAGEKVHIMGHIPPGNGDCLGAWGRNYAKIIERYRVSHLRNSFFKGPKMLENQYVDKKIRQYHNHKASPFDLQPLEWILKLEDSLHSLQHVKTEV